MWRRVQCCLLTFLLLANQTEAAPLEAQELAQILGYPAAQLVIEDVTSQERNLQTLPVIGNRTGESIDPARLISAQQVTGKVEDSFYPLLITIAEAGTFLTEPTREIIARLDTSPATPVSEGGRGAFGSFSVDEGGTGGLILGHVRVPSSMKEMPQPRRKSALVSELRFPDRKTDVRIAVIVGLQNGRPLVKIEGGERYFQTFSSQEDVSKAYIPDLQGLFKSLSVAATRPAPTASSSSTDPAHSSQSSNGITMSGKSEKMMASPLPANTWSTKNLFLWIGLPLAFLLMLLTFLRSRR